MGALGAISALTAVTATDGALAREAAELLAPRSYTELLRPITNAGPLLTAADELIAARARAKAEAEPNAQLAQWGWGGRRHHHHHHHNWLRRRWHHHHHHHHHRF